MKVTIDADLCTGCGLCADNCPDVFELTDDVAKVRVAEVDEDNEEGTRQAVEDCPVEAISIEE